MLTMSYAFINSKTKTNFFVRNERVGYVRRPPLDPLCLPKFRVLLDTLNFFFDSQLLFIYTGVASVTIVWIAYVGYENIVQYRSFVPLRPNKVDRPIKTTWNQRRISVKSFLFEQVSPDAKHAHDMTNER